LKEETMEVEQTSATVEAMPSTEPEMRGGAIKDRRDERNRVVEPGLVRPPVEQLQRAKIAHDFEKDGHAHARVIVHLLRSVGAHGVNVASRRHC
jgi:hypothetical protein